MIYCFPCHCHLRTGPPVLSAKCILMTFGWLPSTILVSMWVEVKTDSVHIKPTHSFQTRAQAAVNTNPNSPQKWQSFCTLTCKRSPALKGVAMGQGGSQSRGLFTPELFLHAWLRSYKSVSKSSVFVLSKRMHGWEDFQTFSRPVALKGQHLCQQRQLSLGQVGNDWAPVWSQNFQGRSPASCTLASPPGTACSSLRPLLYPAWNSEVLNRTDPKTYISVWLLLCVETYVICHPSPFLSQTLK